MINGGHKKLITHDIDESFNYYVCEFNEYLLQYILNFDDNLSQILLRTNINVNL